MSSLRWSWSGGNSKAIKCYIITRKIIIMQDYCFAPKTSSVTRYFLLNEQM